MQRTAVIAVSRVWFTMTSTEGRDEAKCEVW